MKKLCFLALASLAVLACSSSGSEPEPEVDGDGTSELADTDVTEPDTDVTEPDGDADADHDVPGDLDAADVDLDVPADLDGADADVELADADVDAGDEDTDVDPDRCPAGRLGQRLGRDRLFIGGSMDDDAFATSPFDIRYVYLAGNVPTDGPCTSCASNCSVEGQACDNEHGCAWWGCWQWDQEPPGRYVANFIDKVEAAGALPMITYYIWFSVAGYIEGEPEVAELQDGDKLRALLLDWAFVCETVAATSTGPVLLHVEPDLWGYGHQVSDDPTRIPVALSSAGLPECNGLGDHFAGFGHCLLAVARSRAPNALVAFHASAWGAGHDALSTADPGVDLVAHAEETAAFLRGVGAAEADLVVVEMSDRDAGFNDRWWDPANQTRPHFQQAQTWVGALGEALDLPTLWWQVPYGHLGLENVCDRYEDNRVDYVLDHAAEFAAIGSLGVAFGAGASCMTTPATDDGHFEGRAQGYFAAERPCLCGDCP